MDKIFIDGLEIFARHGVLSEENTLGQKFIVSAELECDTHAAGKTDDLTKSVNYAEVCSLIKKVMTENTYRLIEAAAEKIAESVLLNFKAVKSITVTLKKPWAPIAMNMNSVGVKITRSRHTAYIALGSNMGDTRAHLEGAVREINKSPFCTITKVSEFIVTKPVGEVEQDDFLNGCAEVETLFTPRELLDFLHGIENAHGRVRKIHWGPRTLDLDIILYDELVLNEPDLVIPHPEAAARAFVLAPLAEIAPLVRHPLENTYIKDLYKKIDR